jgi:hypothetical protein
MIIILLILTILIDATGDALTLSSKPWAHVTQAITVLLWLFIIWRNDKKKYNWQLRDLLYLIAGYTLIRHGLFDYTWNLVAGQNIFFVGNTSLYDKLISKTFISIWPARLFSFISGIIMLYKLLHV